MIRQLSNKWKIVLSIIFLLMAVEIISAPIEWLWPKRLGGFTHWSGNTSRKQIALTFDDGPSGYTEKILDILLVNNIQATFFVVGRQAEYFPEFIKRMEMENHEIGNHTYSFAARKLIFFSDIQEAEIAITQDIVKRLTSRRPRYYRSPGGLLGRRHWNFVRNQNLKVVYGTLPMPHPQQSAAEQLTVVIKNLKPGAIIILHDGDDADPDSDRPASTVVLLPVLLNKLKERGYEVVPLHQLLEGDGASH